MGCVYGIKPNSRQESIQYSRRIIQKRSYTVVHFQLGSARQCIMLCFALLYTECSALPGKTFFLLCSALLCFRKFTTNTLRNVPETLLEFDPSTGIIACVFFYLGYLARCLKRRGERMNAFIFLCGGWSIEKPPTSRGGKTKNERIHLSMELVEPSKATR